jgi:hypothetical protein
VVKRLLDSEGEKRVRLAVAGIGQVYPFSNGDAWDFFSIERHFTRAVEAGAAARTESDKMGGGMALLDAIDRAAKGV